MSVFASYRIKPIGEFGDRSNQQCSPLSRFTYAEVDKGHWCGLVIKDGEQPTNPSLDLGTI
jgi:hypothetical protein|tara:strand:- start:422 stop:604 length:183 start_codon:yes stop_codon:yes gene_type:complete